MASSERVAQSKHLGSKSFCTGESCPLAPRAVTARENALLRPENLSRTPNLARVMETQHYGDSNSTIIPLSISRWFLRPFVEISTK